MDGKWEDGTRPKDIFSEYVSRNPSAYVNAIISGLGSTSRRVQSGCAEIASLLSETHPDLLYDNIDLFLSNLGAREPVLRWEAVCTLGNLARADRMGKVRDTIEPIAAFLADKSIVLQNHAVKALSKIAHRFPDSAPTILDRLLASKDWFPGNRIGFVIEVMSVFKGDEKLAVRAKDFVQSCVNSDIHAVSSKARKVLRELESA